MQMPSQRALAAFQTWWDALPTYAASGGGPAKGTIAVALVMLDRLKQDYDLRIESHRAKGGAQIRGASPAAVRRILERFGETRPFVKEGGRTNRGGPGDIESMLRALESAELGSLSPDKRNLVLGRLQAFLVDRVRDFHGRQRLKPVYDPAQTTRQFIHELLAKAKETGKHGPVAQHLVGAKLQLRFPDADIRNEAYSAADDPAGEPGDFCLNDTVFHVTVAPSQGHYDKCKVNLQQGRRVFFLVPDDCLIGARQIAEQEMAGRIAVESIESFVGQNIEELSDFTTNRLANGLRRLIKTYNLRVNDVETDKSMLVDVPLNLAEPEGADE